MFIFWVIFLYSLSKHLTIECNFKGLSLFFAFCPCYYGKKYITNQIKIHISKTNIPETILIAFFGIYASRAFKRVVTLWGYLDLLIFGVIFKNHN